MKDPRVKDALYTITDVDVAKDLSSAKVFVTVQGGKETEELVMLGLRQASGYLRRELGKELRLRRIPRLEFIEDTSFDEADRLTKLLRDL